MQVEVCFTISSNIMSQLDQVSVRSELYDKIKKA